MIKLRIYYKFLSTFNSAEEIPKKTPSSRAKAVVELTEWKSLMLTAEAFQKVKLLNNFFKGYK